MSAANFSSSQKHEFQLSRIAERADKERYTYGSVPGTLRWLSVHEKLSELSFEQFLCLAMLALQEA
ncbi:hypothetical protein ACU8KH_03714 [Lachancea thermotolerans]